MPKFGTKNALFGYFWSRILKHYCHILNQQPQIYLFSKFNQKSKMLKLPTKNVCFGYFERNIVILEINTIKYFYLQNFEKNKKA